MSAIGFEAPEVTCLNDDRLTLIESRTLGHGGNHKMTEVPSLRRKNCIVRIAGDEAMEQQRIELLIQCDGEAAACEGARRTLENYRQTLQSPASHASFPDDRWPFELSNREFEDWQAACRRSSKASAITSLITKYILIYYIKIIIYSF